MGITEKPELFPLERLGEQFGFEPPRDAGYNTVEACDRNWSMPKAETLL